MENIKYIKLSDKGEKEAYERVKPILDASYSSVMYTGGLGTAMIPKVK